MRQYYSVIKSNTLFEGINDDELDAVLKCLAVTARSYKKGATIRRPLTPVDTVGLVLAGTVHISKTDYDGNRVILGEIPTGKIFGESLAFSGAENSPITVSAATACTVLSIPSAKLGKKCASPCPVHERLNYNLIKLLAEKIMILQIKNDILSQKTTREKLLLYLEYECKTAGSKSFKIHYNREELADFLCLNASAVSRELGKMRDEGIITFTKNRFVLNNPEGID